MFILAISGELNLRSALGSLDWSILVMLAVMIPLGAAVETTGAAVLLASNLIAALPAGNPALMIGAILALTVAIPLVIGPVAIAVANSAGLAPEPLLIAVALGASIDFLTPVGHHNNSLIMGGAAIGSQTS